jgi:iron complex outermembrane receptor protein
VYSYSDAGGSLGYTYTSIRGFDDRRIATYLNGVPLNDPEDQYSYWVDLPDFLASVTDLQVQRGIGNAQYGDPAFGGSINVVSSVFARKRETRIRLGQGYLYYESDKIGESAIGSIDFSSGIIDGRYAFHGRISQQKSDGYRTQSSAKATGYFLSVGRIDPKMSTELLVFGGPTNLHLSFFGISRDQIAIDRRFNPLSYVGETDNFTQPHYHLHHQWELSDQVHLANTLYFVRGRGYFEQFIADASFAEYGVDSTLTNDLAAGDLVRQQSVTKGQLGWTGRLSRAHDNGSEAIIGSFYTFASDHTGDVIRTEQATSLSIFPHRYYHWEGEKLVGSLGVEISRAASEQLQLSGGLHARVQQYDFKQEKLGLFRRFNFTTDWLFLSPKVGAVLSLEKNEKRETDLYGSFGIVSRAPTDAAVYDASNPNVFPSLAIDRQIVNGADTSYQFGDPLFDAERVTAFEIGIRTRTSKLRGSLNFYSMNFENEIIPYGGINPSSGQLATANANGSTRFGVEAAGSWEIARAWTISGAFSWQRYTVRDFVDTLDVYDQDFNYLRSEEYRFSDRQGLAFPEFLGSARVAYQSRSLEGTLRLQAAGKQYLELGNIDSLSIHPVLTVGFDLGATFRPVAGLGSFRAVVSVDNLFNRKYERSGYGWNYLVAENINAPATLVGGAEYYVAAERSVFFLLEMRFD